MKKFILSSLLMMVCSSALAQDEPSAPILFTNVNVFNGTDQALIKNANVVVTGNKISAISLEPLVVAGGRIIDGEGRTLMPGLIDAHTHIMLHSDPVTQLMTQDTFEQGARGAARAKAYLDAGFTTVRDLGGNCFGVKNVVDARVSPGPRIFCGGASITQTSGHGDFRMPNDGHPRFDGYAASGVANTTKTTIIADGVDDVRAAVREMLFRGASQIKVHAGGGVTSFKDPLEAAQYTQEELNAAVEEAERYGTYVTVHAQVNNAVVASLDAGVKTVEHGLIMEEETMVRMAEAGVYWVPQAFLALQDVSSNPLFQDPIQNAKLAKVNAGARQAFEWGIKHNVKTGWGSDVFGADEIFATFRQEFAFRDEFYEPIEQMQQVTGVNGEILALSGLKNPYPDGPLGVIAEGAYADIILIEGDPSEDIRLLMDSSNISLIMKDGVIYKDVLN
ncbi:amidohydrolase family protein [Roseibium sp.]|uniref:metal-dependent hydrolase family protein n=1 Tax=Roseibium sp. TaxID=1936156 RepID=UPI003D097D39